jgi:hypothetical protein
MENILYGILVLLVGALATMRALRMLHQKFSGNPNASMAWDNDRLLERLKR